MLGSFSVIMIRRLRSLATLCLLASVIAVPAMQGEGTRVLKLRVAPVYPEIARRMNITGVVKLQIVIAADGSVKSVKPLGGHPLLIDSAVQAVKAWKYEK